MINYTFLKCSKSCGTVLWFGTAHRGDSDEEQEGRLHQCALRHRVAVQNGPPCKLCKVTTINQFLC